MIFFFTGTGNSLEAARIIADTTHDKLVDIGYANKTGRRSFSVEQGENLGFVFPVYAWSTPGIVDEFLRTVHFTTSNGNAFVPGYCYCTITCGAFVGKTATFFEELLKKYQNIKLDASFSVKSVGNCVYMYNPADGEKCEELLAGARRSAKEAAYLIDNKRMVRQERRNPFGSLMSNFTCREEKPRSIEPFNVIDDVCTGCGICASICPTNTIHMVKGRPVWSGDDCTQCLACLHRCPVQASQYGQKTVGRNRYTNPILAGGTQPNQGASLSDALEEPIPEPE